MAAEKLFLGIDGGGTKTTAIVTDMKGNIIGRVLGRTINYNSVGLATARENFKEIIDTINQKFHIHYFDTAFIGMSAIYKKAEEREIQSFTEGILNAGSIYMDSDLYIALEGLMAADPCMVIVSGTGSMGIIRDRCGDTTVIGGWGYLICDHGSAYHIAIEGIKKAILSYEGIGKETMLTQKVKEYFHLSNMRDLIDLFYNPVISNDRIAAFAREVYECALLNDKTSLEIINDAAEALALYAFALMEKSNEYNVTIGVYGGVFQSNEILYSRFKEIITNKYKNLIIKPLTIPPEVGAILICFKKNNIDITDEIISNLNKIKDSNFNTEYVNQGASI